MKKKFTLIELLVVVAVIAILLSILLPSLGNARQKSKLLLCLGNQKQISAATQLFLNNNAAQFPYVQFSGVDTNTGRFWVGKKGSNNNYKINVTQRPINQYLGYTQDNIEVPVAACPLNMTNNQYKKSGSNYMAAARQEHDDDFDSESKKTSIYLAQVNSASTMVLFGETGAWHYSYNPNNPWKNGSQFHSSGEPEYSFSFVDGHAKNLKIHAGLGVNLESEILNFRNF